MKNGKWTNLVLKPQDAFDEYLVGILDVSASRSKKSHPSAPFGLEGSLEANSAYALKFRKMRLKRTSAGSSLETEFQQAAVPSVTSKKGVKSHRFNPKNRSPPVGDSRWNGNNAARGLVAKLPPCLFEISPQEAHGRVELFWLKALGIKPLIGKVSPTRIFATGT